MKNPLLYSQLFIDTENPLEVDWEIEPVRQNTEENEYFKVEAKESNYDYVSLT
jgi:hypothetical protein